MTRRGRSRTDTAAAEKVSQNAPGGPSIPKDGIARVNIGQAFAEYDPALEDQQVYVHTPAYSVAQNFDSGKYFFVGRRGTGKTALRRFCATTASHATVVVPEIFSPGSMLLDLDLFKNSAKKPFRSLVSAFRRAIQDELLILWRRDHYAYADLPPAIEAELREFGDADFDSRALQFIARISRPLARRDDLEWIVENKIHQRIATEMKPLCGGQYTLLVDSIDDFWEGTDESVIYLTAFMHACQEVSSQVPWVRALLFLRENIFERVRAQDSESSRLETAVVGMEWTTPQLLELVERRLNRPFNTKLALGGTTWDAWFERPLEARSEIFSYCQRRPRDVLIWVNNAIESAQANKHNKLLIEDLQSARRRFSDNRLKDLGDEYAENYPQLALVLSRFYGLGRSFTLGGLESFVRKLHCDPLVVRACGSWIFEQTASIELFVRMLYNVGFIGLHRINAPVKFRSLGPQDTSAPPISDDVDLVIHKCYWDSLDLQDVLVRELPENVEFGRVGVISELPGGLNLEQYMDELDILGQRLKELPLGQAASDDFEDVVGDIIRLCFFRSLENVERRVRDVDGRVIRDWIAANRAKSGFWERVRLRYRATQIIWECKNYEELKADDFHQASYYLQESKGGVLIVAFRGREITSANLQHIRRIMSGTGGLVLPLTQKDLATFVRQARSGKSREEHIVDRCDHVERRIS